MTAASFPSLANATAIVTGGASGIGEAIVRGFCAQGTKVAFLDIDAGAGGKVAAETGALFIRTDLTDIEDLKAAFAKSRQELGPANVLVNNAANDKREEFEDVTPDGFDGMMAVNLRHVFFAAQAVVPQMRERGGGAIINMSSGAWVGGSPDAPSYVSAKAAIVGLTNSLARKFGPENIRVNAVAPGAVRTERQMKLWHTEETMNALIAQQCIKEQLRPEHIAPTVLFLASDEGRMISKQLIFVNAGLR